MQLDDYCFAGPRKVGGWFGSLGKIGGEDACKVMVFCLGGFARTMRRFG